MSSFHGKCPIIHDADEANLTGFTYLEVYCGVDEQPTINGTAVKMVAGSSIEIVVNSISVSAPNKIYLLGMPKNVLVGSSVLGGTGG